MLSSFFRQHELLKVVLHAHRDPKKLFDILSLSIFPIHDTLNVPTLGIGKSGGNNVSAALSRPLRNPRLKLHFSLAQIAKTSSYIVTLSVQ